MLNDAARMYLTTCRVVSDILHHTIIPSKLDAPDGSDGATYYGRFLRTLRDARVFDVGDKIVPSVAQEIGEHLISTAGVREDYEAWKQKLAPNDAGAYAPPTPNDAHLRIAEHAEDMLTGMPFPIDLLPFPVCWFGVGRGIVVAPEELALMARNAHDKAVVSKVGDSLFTGMLVSDKGGGQVDAVFLVPTEPVPGFMTIEWVSNGRWTDWRTLFSPWLIWAIINITHDARKVVLDNPINDRRWKQEQARCFGKHLKLPGPPKPYYTVACAPEVVTAKLRDDDAVGTKVWTHRFDRRAHERCRVQRGQLPLDLKQRRELVKRGYAIYDADRKITDEDAIRIAVRGMPPRRDDEWIAILPYWVKATVVGPADLPYVPSTHVVREAKDA